MSDEHKPDLTNGIAEADLADGAMLVGRVGDEAVLLARHGGSARSARSIWRRWGIPPQQSFIFAPLPPMTSSARSWR